MTRMPILSGAATRWKAVVARGRDLQRWPPGRPGPAVSGRGQSRNLSAGALVVGLLMIGVILLIGLVLLPKSEHLASLMVAVPATAAALGGPRLTAALAALSCAGALALDAYDGLLGTSIWAIHMIAIIFVSACVVGFRAIRERNVAELHEVRTVSEAIQRVLLRPLPSRLGTLRVRSAYHASQPHALVGGDLYAATRTPTGVRLILGDVKGKGLPAIDDASALLGAFRSVSHGQTPLPELMAYLEGALRTHFEESRAADDNAIERFVTTLVLDIPDDARRAEMINCGHPPPYLASGGTARPMPPSQPSPPLGLNSTRPEDYRVDTFEVPPGATLLAYTDGVVEARNAQGIFYDLDAKLAEWTGSQPEELIDHVLTTLIAHVGNDSYLDDDAAMVALRREATD